MSVANKNERKPPAEGARGNGSSDGSEGGDSANDSPAYMGSSMRRQFLTQMINTLPQAVQDRIVALKNLQLEQLDLSAQFYQEVYELEKKYQVAYQPFYDKRTEIVNGLFEPPKQEPKYPNPEIEHAEDVSEDFSKMLKDVKAIPADAKGVPNFWLSTFKNTELLSDLIKPHDEPALKELRDVKIVYENDNSYTIEFYFGENNFFTNTKLTKQYFLRTDLKEFEDPFNYEGPEIFKCKGCHIDWKPKMNLTVKTITKKQKHKSSGAMRRVFKQVPNDSFFNFFNPPTPAEKGDEEDPDTENLLAADFEIGHYLRACIIPKAILYFTGDIMDEEDDDEDEDDDDDGEYESDEEKTDESDEGGPPRPAPAAKPEDCKHQ